MQATGCRPMLSSGRPPTAPSQECCVEQQMAPDTSGARTEWPSSQRPFLRLNTTILTRNASPFTSRFLIATQHSPRSCWNRHTATLLLSVTVSYCSTENRVTFLPSLFMHIIFHNTNTRSSSKWTLNSTSALGGDF